jgi:hypothetical protein
MKRRLHVVAAVLAVMTLSAGVCAVRADERDDGIRALRAQIDALDQRLRTLEQDRGRGREEAKAVAKAAPQFRVSDRGATAANDAFLVRRGRVSFDGHNSAKTDFFQTDFKLAPPVPAMLSNPVIRQDEKAVVTRLQVAF